MALSHWIILLLSVAAASAASAVSAVSAGARRSMRTKRGVLELAGAIKCSTGRSPMAYVLYGCYCGLGGQGWPRDRVDWCCHKHDCCYGDAEILGCPTKTGRYKWTCEDNTVKCDDLEDRCEKLECKCDKNAAKCLRNARFNRRYATWPDFLCGTKQPMCSMYS